MTPLVSVCIPSYRAEPFLRATLQSVLDQTVADWELILVDDASPDRSWEIAKECSGDPECVDLSGSPGIGCCAHVEPSHRIGPSAICEAPLQ